MWRYRELLPLEDPDNILTLGEGYTPILETPTLGEKLDIPQLAIKDEGLNPTGTFKARGAAAGVARAVELGITEVAMPTAGNAGGAWSAYCAQAGINATIAMPTDAPAMALSECMLYGADVYMVDGLISDAGDIIARGAEEYGWFETSTLKEPYRIEGKKTMGFELVEQHDWEVPDVVIYPTGGGVGIIGIWKALNELEAIGLIGEKRPRMVAVQSTGCAPIVHAFHDGEKKAQFWEDAETIAGGIRVPGALGDFLVLEALYESNGTAVAVTDEELLRAVSVTAQVEGQYICPEGGATVAAAEKLRENGWIKPSDRVVLLNTGTGLKYHGLFEFDPPVLEVGESIER
jgi:threonine synthase